MKGFHIKRLHPEVGVKKIMALTHDDVCITKNGFALAILKDHGFVLSRCWHRKSPYLCFIINLASENYLPQVPVKSSHKVARKVITNKLPHFLSFLIFKPPCYISRLAYRPIYKYSYFHTGLRTSFPKGVRNC